MSKKIKITCKGSSYIPIDQLENFQGALKTLEKSEFDKCERSILKYGFSFPVFIWRKKILDGHQRVYVVGEMLKAGYTIDDIPVCEIEAKNETEAAEKLLLVNSHYAKITSDGLEEFINNYSIDISELGKDLVLPDIDLDSFLFDFSVNSNDENEDSENQKINVLSGVDLDDLKPNSKELKKIKGKKILIEFSGGKDSSTAALWAKHFFPNNEIELCFCDMGADFVGFSIFLNNFSLFIGVKLTILRSIENMFDVFLERGKWPHFGGPYCHQILHTTLHNYYKQYKPNNIVIIRGGRIKERAKPGRQRVNMDRFLVVDKMKNYNYFQPLYFAEKGVCETVLEKNNAPVWDGYEYGLQRTACRICPGQRPIAYAAIRSNFPDVWNELLYFEKKFGPGAWQVSHLTTGIHYSFEEMANKGQSKFDDNDYLTKY